MPAEIERLRQGMRLVSTALAAFAEATPDYHRLLDIVAKNVAEAVGDSCVMLLGEPSGELIAGAIYDRDPALLAELVVLFAHPLGPEGAIARHAMETGVGRISLVGDLEEGRARMSPEMYEVFKRIGLRSTVMVPMRVAGEPIGVLSLLRHRSEVPLDAFDLELVQDLASHAALAISNARMVEALRRSEELERAHESERRANRFLDAIVENIPDMVFVKDADRLAFTLFNRAGEELLGVPRSALLGKTDHDLFPASEAEFFQAKDRETLRNRTLVEIAEEPIQTKVGQRWLHTKKVPILDEDGEPAYLLGISHDITERKHADEQLRAARDHCESASRELEAFSYSVAHDLRAPLRGIDGFSQALLDDYGDKLDAVGRGYLDRVRAGAQRMAHLIDDLLALSRVTRAELTRTAVDLSALAESCVARLLRGEPPRAIEVIIAPGLMVSADPRLLSIALDNLFGNALKFTSKQPAARVELGVTTRDGERAFFVRDNGAGFDMAYVHKLFGVFQRLHTEAEFPGTGVGLATVARIIHRHRGRVWAEGAPGAGATFYFTLGPPGDAESP